MASIRTACRLLATALVVTPLCIIPVVAGGPSASAADRLVWFGTYTRPPSKSEGIYVSRFDDATGALEPPRLAVAVRNPSFLAVHPALPRLYAVAEVGDHGGRPTGAVAAFAIDPATGVLEPRGSEPSGGPGPCHLSVEPGGRAVLAANYGGGSVICLGLGADGGVRPPVPGTPGGFVQHVFDRAAAAGINSARQEKPHAHSVDVTADGRFAVVCDLGLDRVLVYALDAAGATIAAAGAAEVAAGAGPRHFAFHPSGRFGYAVNELDLTVTVFSVAADPAGPLRLEPVQTARLLPAEVTDTAGMTAAEIALHPSGRYLYASTRGHDSITTFAVDAATGRLDFRGVEPIRGRTPRSFAVAPGGRFLLAAGQASDTVTVFAIDPDTGRLSSTGTTIDVPAPVCISFAR